jgi:hypothetical protein
VQQPEKIVLRMQQSSASMDLPHRSAAAVA